MAKGNKENKGNTENESKVFTFRVSGEMIEFLDNLKCKSKVIKNCVNNIMQEKKKLEKYSDVYSELNLIPLRMAFFDDVIKDCGFPVTLNYDERKEVDMLSMLCLHPEATYLIRVKDESMIDAGIYNGDIVIVDTTNRYPSEHQVAVCELNEEYTLKYFRHRGNEGWLVPANPNFPEVHVTDTDKFNIWGIVTYVIHSA